MDQVDEENDLLETNLLPTQKSNNHTETLVIQATPPRKNTNVESMVDERGSVKRLKRKSRVTAQSGRSPKRVKRSESYFMGLASNGEKLLQETKMKKGIGAEKIVDWCLNNSYQIILPDKMKVSSVDCSAVY